MIRYIYLWWRRQAVLWRALCTRHREYFTHTCTAVPGKGIILGSNTRKYAGAYECRLLLFLSVASVEHYCLPRLLKTKAQSDSIIIFTMQKVHSYYILTLCRVLSTHRYVSCFISIKITGLWYFFMNSRLIVAINTFFLHYITSLKFKLTYLEIYVSKHSVLCTHVNKCYICT